MNKILVTGASGDLGRKTLLHLSKRTSTANLVGLVRDPAKAQDLAALGIELRQGDYMDPASLSRAFDGIDKVMLTATHAFTDRRTAQGNVIDAAVRSGVRHLVYMSIFRKDGSSLRMKEITEEDLFTERKLMSSGLDYTIVDHPPFLDVLPFYVGANAHETGINVPAPHAGKFAAASRNDLAEAHAAILLGTGHEGQRYSLTGAPAIGFADIADYLSQIHGRKVPFNAISDGEFLQGVRTKGIPDFIGDFALGWIHGMDDGEWSLQTQALETFIGHKPQTAFEYFRDDYLPA
jgi:NAD(P)H dehydrogenase (quinone)